MTNTIYRNDFYAWTQEQADLLRHEDYADLDLPNLIEEIESMGTSQRSELTSRLKVLLIHLLKWAYQSQMNHGPSWRITIIEQRSSLEDLLEDNPSLRREVPEAFAKAYPRARRNAARETGIELAIFPIDCPWPAEQILDEDWFPGD